MQLCGVLQCTRYLVHVSQAMPRVSIHAKGTAMVHPHQPRVSVVWVGSLTHTLRSDARG